MSRILDHLTAGRVFEWTIGNRLFDLGDLNPAARAVSWFGYGSLLTLLGSMLVLQALGIGLPTTNSAVAVEVVVVACMGFVAAWALIMTGVLYARSAVAVPFLILFGIQMIGIGARVVFASFGVIALAICMQILFRVQPRLRDWSRTPIVSLLMWVLLLAAVVVQAWTTGPRWESFVLQLTGVMGMASVLAIGLWIAMACGAIVTAVRLSIAILGYLRRRLRPPMLRVMVVLMVYLLGPSGMAFGIIERDAAWIIGGGASIALIPAIAILFLMRRWTDRNAMVTAGVFIALCTFTFSLSLAMSDSSRIGRGVQVLGIFPPLLLFLMLAADHLLRFGRPIKRIAPQLGSQVAWVLIYLGVVVLILTALLFLMNHPSGVAGSTSQRWPQALSALTFGTMLVTGPVYLIWVICRRSDWWTSNIACE